MKEHSCGNYNLKGVQRVNRDCFPANLGVLAKYSKIQQSGIITGGMVGFNSILLNHIKCVPYCLVPGFLLLILLFTDV